MEGRQCYKLLDNYCTIKLIYYVTHVNALNLSVCRQPPGNDYQGQSTNVTWKQRDIRETARGGTVSYETVARGYRCRGYIRGQVIITGVNVLIL